MPDTLQQFFTEIKVRPNGPSPWDIQIHDDCVYRYIEQADDVALGEAYLQGLWDCDALDELMSRVLSHPIVRSERRDPAFIRMVAAARLRRFSRKPHAFTVGRQHYDLGNDLYKAMLDKRMVYTCGYWSGTPQATTLDEAQEAKLNLVCRKINLQQGMRVLDIGGGWGSFAKYAAQKYNATVVNISVSKEQVDLATELCQDLSVENRLQDYRDVDEPNSYDRIVSLGMFEHVTPPNYRIFMEKVRANLKDDGLFLLHCIGSNAPGNGMGWIQKRIFPNSVLPTLVQIGQAVQGRFVMEDWHNFGADYDKTLMAWHRNFESHWPQLSRHYDETFHRMWRLYLLSCAAAFRTRNVQLWQVVFTKNGIPGGYHSVR